jgi:type IV fimbrial biogenesis protein FimT
MIPIKKKKKSPKGKVFTLKSPSISHLSKAKPTSKPAIIPPRRLKPTVRARKSLDFILHICYHTFTIASRSGTFKDAIIITMRTKGFSLVELLIAMALIVILASVAIPQLQRFYRTYKYNEYVLEVESTIKWARLVAMERSTNVSVCVQGTSLTVYDNGTSRSLQCSGNVLRTVNITDSFVSIQGSSFNFDPRGLGITAGNVQVKRTDTGSCVKYTVQSLRGFILKEVCS